MNRFITILSSIFLAMGLLIFMVFIITEYDLSGKGNSVGTYDLHGWTRLVYDDPIPFSVEDMMDSNTPWSKEADCSQTLLLSRQEYRQYALSEESPINGMDYTVLDVKWESLYDTCRKAVLNDLLGDDAEDHYLPVDTSPWNASEAYRLYWEDAPLDTYLIFWDGRIVKFEFSWEPTEEQIAIAASKLGTP